MIKRNPALVVIFSIITCGIYTYYWLYVVTRDIENELVSSDGRCAQPAMTVMLALVTCGIYAYYWWYCQGKRTAQLQAERRLAVSDNSLVYLILCLFGLSVVSQALLQGDLNRLADTPRPLTGGSGDATTYSPNNNGFTV